MSPPFVEDQIRQSLPTFDKKIHGYTSSQAILIALESRTSSPIQLLRDAQGQSISHPHLYPCGEERALRAVLRQRLSMAFG